MHAGGTNRAPDFHRSPEQQHHEHYRKPDPRLARWHRRDGRDRGVEGDDWLFGQGGDDGLIGGIGADWLFGGIGEDMAIYWDSATGVYVDLTIGRGFGGTAEGDPCQAFGHHGYNGIERETIDAIKQWIRQGG